MTFTVPHVYDKDWAPRTYYLNRKPDKCPLCNQWIDASYKVAFIGTTISPHILKVVFQCPLQSCNDFFIAKYEILDNSTTATWSPKLEPVNFIPEDFWKDISNIANVISTDFFEIYKEAANAEALWLLKICWPWYRKALEHLVKDYAIFVTEGEEWKKSIRDPKYQLSKCINDHLASHIQIFSQVAAWYWNDETHYTKQNDSDLDDLKKMIRWILVGISYEINAKEAEAIVTKKNVPSSETSEGVSKNDVIEQWT
jgi:hypothetical protein